MAFDTYAGLQSTVLNFIGRPGDPAVAPFVPDFVTLFEREANRRLRVIDAERYAAVPVTAAPIREFVLLPSDCWQVRDLSWADRRLEYLQPGGGDGLYGQSGTPRYYTLYGQNAGGRSGQSGLWTEFYVRLMPVPAADGTLQVTYQVGVPPLSESRPINWLLDSHGDAYLYGTLVEAEAFIGNDERAPMWLARRDAAFVSIEAMDRKTRWAGPLTIRPDFMELGGGGAAVPPTAQGVVPMPATGGVRVVSPISGGTVTMSETDRSLLVISGPLALLKIVLPPADVMTDGEYVEISFYATVTMLLVTRANGTVLPEPTEAYGPGAALVFRWLTSEGFVYWK